MIEALPPLVRWYVNAQVTYNLAAETLESMFTDIFDGRLWGTFSINLHDWDGISIEFTEADAKLVPTEAHAQRFWALGFTVIRVDYRDPRLQTPQHGIRRDWWQVRGLAPLVHKAKP